jgi:hypothetical protein
LGAADDRLLASRLGADLAKTRKAAQGSGPEALQAAARLKTARFALQHDRAKVLSRVESAAFIDEWIDDPQLVVSGKLRRQLEVALTTQSLSNDPRFTELAAALDSGDRDRVLSALDTAAKGAGLTRIGGNPADGYDQIVVFDRTRYHTRDTSIRPGQKVRLVSPGYASVDKTGEQVVLEKATVEQVDPDELARLGT